jgi:hypothetical protein
VTQAQLLLRDLKIAQCRNWFLIIMPIVLELLGFTDTKLPPRAAFTAQIIGTLFGSVLNFGRRFFHLCGTHPIYFVFVFVVLMNSIIDNQRDILLSVQGTNVWSGQQPQQYNSQAIAWGALRYSCRYTSLLINCLLTH